MTSGMRKLERGFPLALVWVSLGLIGCGGADDGAPEVLPTTSTRAEIALRVYLLQNFAEEEWSPRVGVVDVKRRRALISTTLTGDEGKAAAEVCSAAISFKQVKRVVVRYGRGRTEACP